MKIAYISINPMAIILCGVGLQKIVLLNNFFRIRLYVLSLFRKKSSSACYSEIGQSNNGDVFVAILTRGGDKVVGGKEHMMSGLLRLCVTLSMTLLTSRSACPSTVALSASLVPKLIAMIVSIIFSVHILYSGSLITHFSTGVNHWCAPYLNIIESTAAIT